MKENLKPVVNENFSIEKFNNEILLYDKEAGQAVYLNDTAYAVLLLCKEELTVGEIIQYLEERYPDQIDGIKDDVVYALHSLDEKNVITFHEN